MRNADTSTSARMAEHGLIAAARRSADAISTAMDATRPPSCNIPGFEILREIHRGGQGVVYQAVQKATGRNVAIKVMREGPFAGQQDRARFEREVQILGQLNHPHIVAIHDSGTADGHFYHVMNYIAGEPLDVHVAGRHPSVKETLSLFVKICDAVHAAHLMGVIHRDCKPSNVRIDANGNPHILDFGLAKMDMESGADDAHANAMTLTGQFVGSLPWASPEQALGDQARVDIRTDVYSLGVMLYQMLTGKFPYAVTGNASDVLDNIIHADPIRPGAIRPQINDEVETIVLKCLSKEHDRRYQTAGELSRDLQHYLEGRPIEAKRDSSWYVLRKTMRRHRTATGVTLTFLLLVTASAATLLFMYRSVVTARDQAVNAEQAVKEQLAQTESAYEEGKAVTSFLTDMLGSVSPIRQGKEVTVREVLDIASDTLSQKFADAPRVEARVRETIGSTYLDLGEYDRGEMHLERAATIYGRLLGEQDKRTLTALALLANALRLRGDYEAGEAQLQSTLEAQRRVLGESHLDTLKSMHTLATVFQNQGRNAEAEEMHRKALEIRRRILGDEHSDTLISVNNLANVLNSQGRSAEAETLHRTTLEIRLRLLGEENLRTLRSMGNLANAIDQQGRFAEGEALRRKTLNIQRRVLGDEHPETLLSMNLLANEIYSQGRSAEAEQLQRSVLATQVRVQGPEHPQTLLPMFSLAVILNYKGSYDLAEELFRKALEVQSRVVGETHPDTLMLMADLAKVLAKRGHQEKSMELIRGAITSFRARAESQVPVAFDLDAFASLLLMSEPPSLSDAQAALDAAERAVEMTDRQNFTMLGTLARAYQKTAQIELAIETQRAALGLLPIEMTPTRAEFESKLGEYLLEQNYFQEAEPLLIGGYTWMRDNSPEGLDPLKELLGRIIKLYQHWHNVDPSGGYAEKAAAYYALRSPEDNSSPPSTTHE